MRRERKIQAILLRKPYITLCFIRFLNGSDSLDVL